LNSVTSRVAELTCWYQPWAESTFGRRGRGVRNYELRITKQAEAEPWGTRKTGRPGDTENYKLQSTKDAERSWRSREPAPQPCLRTGGAAAPPYHVRRRERDRCGVVGPAASSAERRPRHNEWLGDETRESEIGTMAPRGPHSRRRCELGRRLVAGAGTRRIQ
jgi:hypothetical protein